MSSKYKPYVLVPNHTVESMCTCSKINKIVVRMPCIDFYPKFSLQILSSWLVKEMSGTGIFSKNWRRAIFYPVRSAKRYEVQLTLTTHNDAHHQTKLTTTTFHLNTNARINKRHHATWRNRDRSQYNTQTHPPLCSTSHRRRHCSL